jgi:hypothetical protein
MFRRVFRLALLGSAFALGGMVGCGLLGQTVEGSGKAASEERAVGEVTEVTLSGVGDLLVVPGEATRLMVEGDDNIVPLLETESKGGKLELRVKSGFSVRPKTRISYTLFVPKLERLTVSGAGNAAIEALTADALTVKVSGAGDVKARGLECKELTLTVSGAGDVTLAGSANKLSARVSGSGDVKAGDFKVGTADMQISGSGDATVWATDELKARVSGAGDVKYKGSPRVDKKVSGAGSVKPAG